MSVPGRTLLVTRGGPNLACINLADDALVNGPRLNLFGTSTNLVAFWWREILLVGLGLAGAASLRRRSGRRARPRPHASTSTTTSGSEDAG
ncbi:MAG: hypothetical protein LWW86_04925 [Micrococcales bacterium]|nr:hypothetical protein [Micrococcales bacterium]